MGLWSEFTENVRGIAGDLETWLHARLEDLAEVIFGAPPRLPGEGSLESPESLYALLVSDPRVPAETKRLLQVLAGQGGGIARLLVDLLTLSSVIAIGNAFSEPMIRTVRQAANSGNRNELLSVTEVIRAFWWGAIDDGQLRNELALQGLDDSRIEAIVSSARPVLDLATAIRAWRRGVLDTDELFAEGMRDGWTAERISWTEQALREMIPAATAIEAWWRGLLTEEDMRRELRSVGYTDDRISTIVAASRPLLTVSELTMLFHRGVFDEEEYRRRMRALGYEDPEITLLTAVSFPIPPIPDLVRFAVREVFSPDIRQEFGLDADFPEEFARFARQQGLTEEWARAYWAAHWELPSVQMGFEMFHRGIITGDELRTLMRTQDIMPFWRDRLIQISYNPLTRVDVRRMHKLGVLDRDGVKRAYLDLGYSPEHAEALTVFTEQLNGAPDEGDTNEVRSATKGEVLTLYRAGVIPREDAQAMLVQLDYPEDLAQALLVVEDLKAQRDVRDIRTQTILTRLKSGVASFTDAVTELDALGLSPHERDLALARAELERARDIRLPSLAQLRDMFQNGVISEAEFAETLSILGYPDVWRDRIVYLERVKMEVV